MSLVDDVRERRCHGTDDVNGNLGDMRLASSFEALWKGCQLGDTSISSADRRLMHEGEAEERTRYGRIIIMIILFEKMFQENEKTMFTCVSSKNDSKTCPSIDAGGEGGKKRRCPLDVGRFVEV